VGQPRGRVLFVGQCYYNTWYLSRALRKLGWKADVLNWDPERTSQMFYHGEDFRLSNRRRDVLQHLWFYLWALRHYDIFHFSNAHGMIFGQVLHSHLKKLFGAHSEIYLLKRLGKKIVYSHNGCLDGVSQSAFRRWGPEPVCDICPWRDVPTVCSDERNLAWGKLRNSLADYQCLLGGNRVDYNDDPRVHEVPEFYCLDPEVWRPDLLVPSNYRLPLPADTVKIYHSVGNFDSRTDAETHRNVKTTHLIIPTVERLKANGYQVELIFFKDVPNKILRYYQVQADIFLDMLTFGFFGASVREGLMLGKPAVCFLRPEWLESMRREIPEYVAELPVISATPETVYDVLRDLIENAERRREVGQRSRAFALKWHSADVAARRFDQIYTDLLRG
jgi:glycosyltransferase involved in cell wall biosynthesis